MRATAALARRLSAEAAEQSIALMREGKSVAVRELAAAGKLWSATAHSLAQAVAVTEASEVRLESARAELTADVIRMFFAQGLGAPIGTATGAVLRELLEQAGDGATLSVAPARAEAARREVRGIFEQPLRAEIAAEHRRAVEEQVSALATADAEDEEDGREPDAEELVTNAEVVPDAPSAPTEPVEQKLTPREEQQLGEYRWVYVNEATARRELERDRREGRIRFPRPSSLSGAF